MRFIPSDGTRDLIRTVMNRGWCNAMQEGMHIMYAVLAHPSASSSEQNRPRRPQDARRKQLWDTRGQSIRIYTNQEMTAVLCLIMLTHLIRYVAKQVDAQQDCNSTGRSPIAWHHAGPRYVMHAIAPSARPQGTKAGSEEKHAGGGPGDRLQTGWEIDAHKPMHGRGGPGLNAATYPAHRLLTHQGHPCTNGAN